jgi:hypothetical protein
VASLDQSPLRVEGLEDLQAQAPIPAAVADDCGCGCRSWLAALRLVVSIAAASLAVSLCRLCLCRMWLLSALWAVSWRSESWCGCSVGPCVKSAPGWRPRQ